MAETAPSKVDSDSGGARMAANGSAHGSGTCTPYVYIYIYSLSLEKKSADADSAREDRSSKPVVVDLVLDKGSIYRARRLGAVLPAPRKLQWAATGNVCVR